MDHSFALNYMNKLFAQIEDQGIANTASFIFRRDLADVLIARYGWQPESATKVAFKMTVDLPMDLYETHPDQTHELNANIAAVLDRIEVALAEEYKDNQRQYEIAMDAILADTIKVKLDS